MVEVPLHHPRAGMFRSLRGFPDSTICMPRREKITFVGVAEDASLIIESFRNDLLLSMKKTSV
jgi:hypothetical protein